MEKELSPGYSATVDGTGTLTLAIQLHKEDTAVLVQLPPQAVRSLLNLLRTQKSRDLIGYRKWQQENTSSRKEEK